MYPILKRLIHCLKDFMKPTSFVSAFLFIVLPVAAAQTDVELKKEKSELAGQDNAKIDNIMSVLTRMQEQTPYAYDYTKAQGNPLDKLIDQKDAEDILVQAKIVMPLLAKYPKTKELMENLNDIVLKVELITKQTPSLIGAYEELEQFKNFVHRLKTVVDKVPKPQEVNLRQELMQTQQKLSDTRDELIQAQHKIIELQKENLKSTEYDCVIL